MEQSTRYPGDTVQTTSQSQSEILHVSGQKLNSQLKHAAHMLDWNTRAVQNLCWLVLSSPWTSLKVEQLWKKLFLLNHKRKDCKDTFQNLFSFQISQPSESRSSLSNCVAYLQMCHTKGNESWDYWTNYSISGNTTAVSFGKLTKEVST